MMKLLSSINLPDSGRLYLGNLPGSALALSIAEILVKHQGVSLIITESWAQANELEEAIRFFNIKASILNFPDWETLPYERFSPHPDIISQRIATLLQLPTLAQGALILSISTLLQKLPLTSYIQSHSFQLSVGEAVSLDSLRSQLEQSGYHEVSQVVSPGEIVVRGSILDIFPMGSPHPFRIDFLDEVIDSIRSFDPETQRSIQKIDKISLLPAREFPLDSAAISLFRQNWRESFPGNPAEAPIYQAVSQGFSPSGIEYYLPLFFTKLSCLIDYFRSQLLVIQVGNVHQAAEHFWQEINQRYEQGRYDISYPLLPPHKLYISVNDLFAQLNKSPQIIAQAAPLPTENPHRINLSATPPVFFKHDKSDSFAELKAFLRQTTHRILFSVESLGRKEILNNLLNQHQIHPKYCTDWADFLATKEPLSIIISPLQEGLTLPAIYLLTENQLFGQKAAQRRKETSVPTDQMVRSLAELQIGMPVVHIEHGIGCYQGLQTLSIGEQQAEFLVLEYANKDKLYIPITALNLISRYTGLNLDQVPLHKLGSDQWEKTKRKAIEKIRDIAAELLHIYAQRAAHTGYAFHMPVVEYQLFCADFPFEETTDQKKAIEEVIQDMCSPQPMDRLICGDVGFGKTEVAMRAAFLAVQNGKQVNILVPTTLLAQQHYENFRNRFAQWPIEIDVISRFKTSQQQKEILHRLQQGKIDLIIGTHRLLQKDVQFKNLGLVIVDEEHRFGVQQKEKLKSLRTEVDILTLTATPIPRTLNMALSGLRALSVIATPPAHRLAIKTFVREYNPTLIREAVLRELLRGGQVYFLHNEVQSIQQKMEELKELIPEARITIAHGQMLERELEQVMLDFYHKRVHILVCTTIIETGIDIPNANTIIINRADRLGLAQLHQLRGRVGRSHHQAYAYLMTPHPKLMTSDATKRLQAIAELEDLGSGFTLAMQDLEIRGAGEILGEEQSGSMQSIGFSLYTEFLDQAIKALKLGQEPKLEKLFQPETEIDLSITVLIPDDYISDVHLRLVFYKKIAAAPDITTLNQIQIEMIDRFGLLPEFAQNLFEIAELKLKLQAFCLRKISLSPQGGYIDFEDHTPIQPRALIKLVQTEGKIYTLEGSNRLKFNISLKTANERISYILKLVTRLANEKI